jgi:hypothetical protein
VLRKNLDLIEATKGLAGYKEEYFCGGDLEILAAGMTSAILALRTNTWFFSVDLDTMEVVKCKCKTKRLRRASCLFLVSCHGHLFSTHVKYQAHTM